MIQYNHEFFQIYAGQKAKKNNLYCGDSFHVMHDEKELVCILADGLGSGEFAYESSQAIVEVVKKQSKESVEKIMADCNLAMIGKRGAAVAVFKLNFITRELTYCCVGNIRFFLFPPDEKSIYPMPVSGFLSGRKQRYKVQKFICKPKTRFLFYTDGFIPGEASTWIKNCKLSTDLIERINQGQTNENDDVTFIVGSLF